MSFFDKHKLVGGRWIPNNDTWINKDFKGEIKRKTLLQKLKEWRKN